MRQESLTALQEWLAYSVISEEAPEELELFEDIFAQRDGAPTLKDEGLGFGIPFPAELLSPAVIQAAIEAATYIAKSIFDSGVGILTDLGKDRIKRSSQDLEIKQSRSSKVAPPEIRYSFSPQELAKIRNVAIKSARDAGLTLDRAGNVADKIVAKLALLA